MWCRGDARLWHACYSFTLEALYVVSLRRPTEACFILLSFRGVASDTRSVLYFCSLIAYSYEQPACVHHGFLFRGRRCDHRIFQRMIIICYIIPVFIMFASTFKVLTGLSLAIVLARFCSHGEERRDASRGTHSMEIAASRR